MARRQFEYRALTGRLTPRAENSILRELGSLGREGWELVATAFQGANEHTLLLKREIIPTPSDKEGGL